jgi:hypothetical protein
MIKYCTITIHGHCGSHVTLIQTYNAYQIIHLIQPSLPNYLTFERNGFKILHFFLKFTNKNLTNFMDLGINEFVRH